MGILRERSIFARYLQGILLVLLAAISLVGGVTYVIAINALEQSAKEALEYQAEFRKNRLLELFDSQERWMENLSTGSGFRNRASNLLHSYQWNGLESSRYQLASIQFREGFEAVLGMQGVDALFLLNPEGELVFSLQGMDTELGMLLSEKGFYGRTILSDLLAEVKRKNRLSVSKYGLVELMETTTMLMAIPLFEDSDAKYGADFEGILVRPFSLTRLNDLVRNYTGLGNTGDIIVAQQRFNGDGANFIAGFRPGTILEERTEHCERLFRNQPHLFPMRQALAHKSGNGWMLNSICGSIYAIWSWIPDLDMGLVVRQNRSEILAPVIKMQERLVVLIPLVLIVLVLFVRYISLILTRPITQLTEHVINGSSEQFEASGVTEINKLSDALFEKERSLLELGRTKDEFLSNMSHELRTPLTSIIGNSEFLLEHGCQLQHRDMIESIKVAGENQLALVNDILDMSKIQSGKFTISEVTYDLSKMLRTIRQMFSLRAANKGLELVVEERYRETYQLIGDVQRIQQVLINLIGNAIKFTERGKVTVTAERVGQHLAFKVQDTGVGMNPADQEKLFQRFEQADGSISRRFGGSGLGLYISLNLAELMGGTVDASSKKGIGSIFTLVLPYQPSELPVSSVGEDAASRQRGEYYSGSVLVAEDTIALQLLERRILERVGVDVTTVENGQEAVNATMRQSFDLILMDMQMPVLDGIKATQILRRRGYEKPIVALTANVMPHHREAFEKAGCSGFLAKPIDRDALRQTLTQYLEVKSDPTATLPLSGVESAALWRVLAIDDEQDVLDSYALLLGEGEEVVEAEFDGEDELSDASTGPTPYPIQLDRALSGHDGYQMFEKALSDGCPYSVILLDIRMQGGWDGLETAKRVRRLDSDVRIIFVTAYMDHAPEEIRRQIGLNFEFLHKPFNRDELVQLVLSLANSWSQFRELFHSRQRH